MTYGCNICMICLKLNWLSYDVVYCNFLNWYGCYVLQVFFNNFLLIDATERSKISSDKSDCFSRTLPLSLQIVSLFIINMIYRLNTHMQTLKYKSQQHPQEEGDAEQCFLVPGDVHEEGNEPSSQPAHRDHHSSLGSSGL